jgi:ankyrin repeat protein
LTASRRSIREKEQDSGFQHDKVVDRTGKTDLLHACMENSLERVKDLLLQGGNPIQQDFDGNDAISYAILNNDSNMLELIFNHSRHAINVNKCIHVGNVSYLILAARRGNPHLLRVLLKYGANPNFIDDYGKTALFYCVEKDNTIAMDILATAHADLNVVDKKGLSALDYAFSQKRDEVLLRLIKHGAILGDGLKKRELLFYACLRNQPLIIHELFKRGVLTDERDKDGNTVIMACYLQKKFELCKLLLQEYNLEHLLNAPNYHKENLLLRCGLDDNYEMLRYFIRYSKFDLNYRYEHEKTMMMIAAALGNQRLIDALLENGAKPNLQDKFGRTSLIIAVKHGNVDCIRTLLKHKIDVLAKDLNRRNAYDYAEGEEIRNMLREYMLANNQVSDKLAKEIEKAEFQNMLRLQEAVLGRSKKKLGLTKPGASSTQDLKESASMPGMKSDLSPATGMTLGLLGNFYVNSQKKPKLSGTSGKARLRQQMSTMQAVKSYVERNEESA